jgi:hypothetical protein
MDDARACQHLYPVRIEIPELVLGQTRRPKVTAQPEKRLECRDCGVHMGHEYGDRVVWADGL